MALDKGFSRTSALVVGGVVGSVLIIGTILYVISSKKSESGASNVALGQAQQVSQSDPSPKYNQILEKHNTEQAGRAIKAGESYVPVFTAPSTAQPAEPSKQQVHQQVQYTQATSNQPMSPALQQQVDALRKAWEPPSGVVFVGSNDARSGSPTAVASPVNQPPAKAASAAPKRSLLNGKSPMAPAILNTAIKTDEPALAMATITAGPMSGGVLRGEAKRIGEVVDVKFSSMYLNGHYITVNAVAVDEDSMRSALTGEVDRKFMARIGLPILMGALGGFTTAMAAVPATTISSPFGSVTSTTGSADARQITAAGIAAGAQAATKVAQQTTDQSKDISVTIPQGQAIGIWFLSDVLEP